MILMFKDVPLHGKGKQFFGQDEIFLIGQE